MMRGRRGGPGGLALGLLFMQMAQVGFNRIPPVTLLTIGGQVALYLKIFAGYWSPSISATCVSALRVWYQDDWQRLILASFFHADEWHLYFNMVSMLWKGVKLEHHFGSVYFFGLLSTLSVLCNVMYVTLSMLADQLLHDSQYITTCAVGFSGVLFALKVISNYELPTGTEYVMGIPLPSRFVCWAELILIHFIAPNSSFIGLQLRVSSINGISGHLGGILVGFLYVLGPLRWIMDAAFSLFRAAPATSYSYHSGSTGFQDRGQTLGRGAAARGDTNYYQRYTGGATEEEQLSHATDESIHNYYDSDAHRGMPMPDHGYRAPASYTGTNQQHIAHTAPSVPYASSTSDIDQELLRRRRLERFQQTSPRS